MMALVMSQLQPVLQGFNRSLEHLRRQVGDLARDVVQLKSGRLGAELQPQVGTMEELRHNEEAEEIFDAKLDVVYDHIREVQTQIKTHMVDMDNKLHSQHAMLHYNLTSFKMDIDMKLKRQQKTLQISLQAMNTSLSELKVNEGQTAEAELEDRSPPPPSMLRPQSLPPTDSSTLWDAIERLDNMVVNNTVKVGGLMEDMDVTSGNVQRLRFDLKELEKLINQTARRSQILFMETGLEVEEAKVGVMTRVEELTRNMTQQIKHLQELDMDVDDLYVALYKNHSVPDCDCKALSAAVVRLEMGVANVTALANENRLALEEHDDSVVDQWGGASDWEPAVEALQHGLQLVRGSLVSDQTRTRTLNQSVNQLSSLVNLTVAEVSGLKERGQQLKKDMQNLSGFFNSLLKDAIRHSDVLELLLGEEVLEFLEWPVQDQEASSIPALKEQLRNLQEELRGHSLSISSLLSSGAGGREEVPSADQPSSSSSSSHFLPDDQLPGGSRRSSSTGEPVQEPQHFLRPDVRHPEHVGDGSDLWKLEKIVQQLGLKMKQLEDKPCPCPSISTEKEALSKLQKEVMWLKRGLEEHLRVFKNVFTNIDVLVASNATLDLDKVWQLVRNQKTKRERKRGGGGGRGEEPSRGRNHRNRRDLPGGVLVPSSLSEDSVMFVASLRIWNSVMTFDASLNRGQFHSNTGTFTAPVDAVYVFILTLNLKSGSTHMVLKKGGGVSVSLHRQNVTAAGGAATSVSLLPLRKGEEIWLELRGGAWADSEDNIFTGLLLHRTT